MCRCGVRGWACTGRLWRRCVCDGQRRHAEGASGARDVHRRSGHDSHAVQAMHQGRQQRAIHLQDMLYIAEHLWDIGFWQNRGSFIHLALEGALESCAGAVAQGVAKAKRRAVRCGSHT